MDLSDTINQILKQKQVTFSTFAEHIDVPEEQLRESLEKNSIEIRILERMSKELKIPLYRFFRQPLGDLTETSEYSHLAIISEQDLNKLKAELSAALSKIEFLKRELISKDQQLQNIIGKTNV